VYQLIRSAYPSGIPGLVPGGFAVPSLLGLAVLLKRTPLTSPARNTQLALFGGAALFFITLIFPIQLDRHGSRWAGRWKARRFAGCFIACRIRECAWQASLCSSSYSRASRSIRPCSVIIRAPRSQFSTGIFTLTASRQLCLFAAARLLAPPRDRVLGHNALPLLYTLATVLAFLIVNIEIADYFSAPGAAALTFQFSGNFARDMSYSIAWALFALLMLIVGIRKQIAAVRYASLGLARHHRHKTFLPRPFAASNNSIASARSLSVAINRNSCVVLVSSDSSGLQRKALQRNRRLHQPRRAFSCSNGKSRRRRNEQCPMPMTRNDEF